MFKKISHTHTHTILSFQYSLTAVLYVIATHEFITTLFICCFLQVLTGTHACACVCVHFFHWFWKWNTCFFPVLLQSFRFFLGRRNCFWFFLYISSIFLLIMAAAWTYQRVMLYNCISVIIFQLVLDGGTGNTSSNVITFMLLMKLVLQIFVWIYLLLAVLSKVFYNFYKIINLYIFVILQLIFLLLLTFYVIGIAYLY